MKTLERRIPLIASMLAIVGVVCSLGAGYGRDASALADHERRLGALEQSRETDHDMITVDHAVLARVEENVKWIRRRLSEGGR